MRSRAWLYFRGEPAEQEPCRQQRQECEPGTGATKKGDDAQGGDGGEQGRGGEPVVAAAGDPDGECDGGEECRLRGKAEWFRQRDGGGTAGGSCAMSAAGAGLCR